MSTKGTGFFSLLLASAALIVTVSVIQIPTKLGSSAKGNPRQTVTLNFNLGWNMFSLPMETGKTASDVCNELGPDTVGVAVWDNASVAYTLYICDSPGNTPDFTIDPYVGYAALTPTASTWTVTGELANQNLELEEGWTFTGFKYRGQNLTASDLCTIYNNYHGKLDTISVERWGETGGWQVYLCNQGVGNNFSIDEYNAYFLQMRDRVPPNPPSRPNLPSLNN